MTLVEKGAAPRIYSHYGDAGADLRDRIGDYCSYCERQIETNLAVEHIQPKSLEPALETDWDNFLLGCVNCNSSKGDTPVNLEEYFWPDLHNTLLSFQYQGGLVSPQDDLDDRDKALAEATIFLAGLDKIPGNPDRDRRPTSSDRRWLRREEVNTAAMHYRDALRSDDRPVIRELIVDVATSRGMFSIWFSVFSDDKDMRQRLIHGFTGTAADCFDSNFLPVLRPTGDPD